MKILVIGQGGREHALAWKLAQSQRVQKVFIAPGNAGTLFEEKLENVPLTKIKEYADFARENKIAFTVVGPEAPLAEGVVDFFQKENLPIFGPSQKAARLESSKNFAKELMVKYAIPTAHFQSFKDQKAAHDYINQNGAPIVIKQDGLAAGKGVVVANNLKEAHEAVDSLFIPGHSLVIEEFLEGEEASFIVMCDGKNVLPFATSQDHKRVWDGDKGPNTGGMGAYSPAPVVSNSIFQKTMEKIILPTVSALNQEGTPFVGFLYAGLMIAKGEVKTLEFNCRLGDPETQPILMRLESDLVGLIELALKGKLNEAQIQWKKQSALGVVLAAHNYPDSPQKGDEILGLSADLNTENLHIFHAGTSAKNGKIFTNGGRVLCVVALGEELKDAQNLAYQNIARIQFNGMHFRKDIGNKAL